MRIRYATWIVLVGIFCLCLMRGGYSQGLPRDFLLKNAASGRKFRLPVGIAFAPGNRVYVAEKKGQVYVIDNGRKVSIPFIDLSSEVLSNESNGLLGIAVDPDFGNNRWVYLLYVVDPTGGLDDDVHAFSRLTRYRAQVSNLNRADLSSRQVLIGKNWSDGIIACGKQHVIGSLRWGSDGTLLVSAGEASLPGQVDAGGGHPECFISGRTNLDEDIGAFRAQYIGSLAGKILRIDKETGGGVPSNPFYTGNPDARQSKVWCYGLRNPFRFGVRPGGSVNPADGSPGTLYIGDVGWGQYEEISLSKAGGGENFGWPCHEGPRSVSGYQRKNPPRGSCKDMGVTPENPANHTLPLVHWHHTVGTKSNPTGILGNSVTGGAFYVGMTYPQPYQGYFVADFAQSWIRVLEVDANDNFVAFRPFLDFLGGNEAHGIVDLQSHPETGDIYYVDITTGEVIQIIYTGVVQNQNPVAVARADTLWGQVPLTVHFLGSDSFDPDGDLMSFQWDFGNGDTSTAPDPVYTYIQSGVFTVQLTVSDGRGGQDITVLEISPGSLPPVVTIIFPQNGASFFPTEQIDLQGIAQDADEPEANLQYLWEIDLHHNDHAHPASFQLPGRSGSIIPGEHGDPWDFIYLEVKLLVTDSQGLTGKATHYVVMKVPGETDVTASGTPVALITNPLGSGNPDIEVIRDNIFPLVNSNDPLQQYDTQTASSVRSQDWIGYEFAETRRFSKLLFQEGIHFPDGGWFESLNVQVRKGGVWQNVFFLQGVPPYAGNNGTNYETTKLLFSPEEGDAIRMIGTPGGGKKYISVGELRVFETPFVPPSLVALVFNPTDDAFVRSSRPADNHGDSIELRVRKSAADQIAYLKFAVSGIAGNIINAKLRLYCFDGSVDGGAVYAVSNTFRASNMPWAETGLLWTNAPEVTGLPLSAVGPVTIGATVEFDVTAAIVGSGTYSFAVRNKSSDAARYHSKENVNPPELLVEFDSGSPALPAPIITSFAPLSGPVGSEVDIVGSNFDGATEVAFNGVPSLNYIIQPGGHILAEVPAGASTGKIRVTAPGGTALSFADFTVVQGLPPAPTISSFSPASGLVGAPVTIIGANFTSATAVAFNGTAASFSVPSDAEILTTVPNGASTGPITVENAAGVAASAADFMVETAGGSGTFTFLPTDDAYVRSSRPNINKGLARDLRVRRTVTAELLTYFKFHVSGLGVVNKAILRLHVSDGGNDGGSVHLVSNFFEGTSTPWEEKNLTYLNAPKATRPALSSSGPITLGTIVEFDVTAAIVGDGIYSFGIKNNSNDLVKYRSKESSNPPELIIQASSLLPEITSFDPFRGTAGVEVTIVGKHFSALQEVTFNGVPATTFHSPFGSTIQAVVPTGATTGKISVTTVEGTALSGADFTVTPPSNAAPRIDSFTPTNGPIGTEVTIAGVEFGSVHEVSFAGRRAFFAVDSDTQIRAIVPDLAISGKISIFNSVGLTVSVVDFVVETPTPTPIISGFTPASGAVGTEVTVDGAHFTDATAVNFNGVSASFVPVSDSRFIAVVPAGASTGQITVNTPGGTATSAVNFVVETGTGPTNQTLTFNPTDDAFARSSRPGTNYGASQTLRVRKSSSAWHIAFLKFSVSGLSGNVVAARLRLHVTDASNDGGTVYSAGNAWDEASLVWTSIPDITSPALSSVGAVALNQVVEFDVTGALVGDGVYSFALKSRSNDAAIYSSKEGLTAPALVIETAAAAAMNAKTSEISKQMAFGDAMDAIPDAFSLHPNYPNPFNPETRIVYGLPEATEVKLTIYNIRGELVRILVDAYQIAGLKRVVWDGKDTFGRKVGSGIYFSRLSAGQQVFTRRMILQK